MSNSRSFNAEKGSQKPERVTKLVEVISLLSIVVTKLVEAISLLPGTPHFLTRTIPMNANDSSF